MVWTTAGLEFEKDARKTAVIFRALYGLKSAGAAFRGYLARCMGSMGYFSCMADLDLWLKPEIRQEDRVQYSSNLKCDVDDILCTNHNTVAILWWLCKSFPHKLGFGNPDMYLGVKLCKTRLYNEVWTWAVKYVQDEIRNWAAHLMV